MSSQLSYDSPHSGARQGTIGLLQDEPTFSDPRSHDIPLEEGPLDRFFNSTEKKVVQMLVLLAELQGGDHGDHSLAPRLFHD